MTQKPARKFLYSILAGVLLTASFPPGKMGWLAWFALVPLLKSLENEAPSHAFKYGFIMGFAHYLTLIYWIVVVLKQYGNLNFFISLAALIILSIYLSLYPAIFSYLICYIKRPRFFILMMASLWVGLEYIRAKALTGFPWCLLGYTQYRHLNLIQIAELVGVYGLSFLILISNALIYEIFFDRNRPLKRLLIWEIPIISLIAVFTLAYGHHRLSDEKTKEKNKKTINIAIIQGNIDQSVKWNPVYQQKTIDIYHRLSRTTYSFKPDMIVWPETSVPFFFQNDTDFSHKVFEIPEESGAHLIFGSPAYRREDGVIKYYNRAYHLSPDRESSGYYDKVHLVPFGEYVPLQRFFPFIHRLVTAAGDFVSGEKIAPLKLPHLSAGILICFEVIFPELARTHAKKGAQILVNLTNDAWYGRTSAPYQHLCMAVFRSVENGKPMIRAANTGFSTFISSRGKIIAQGELFTEETLKHEVKVGDSSQRFYTRYGDMFAIVLLIISLIKIFYVLCYNLFTKQVHGSGVHGSRLKSDFTKGNR